MPDIRAALESAAVKAEGENAPLFHEYPGQNKAQRAFLEISPAPFALRCDWNPEVGNAVPFSVWHHRAFRVHLPAQLAGWALAEWLRRDDVAEAVEQIVAGYSERWDGSNRRGKLDEGAEDAMGDLRMLAEQLDDPYRFAEFEDDED